MRYGFWGVRIPLMALGPTSLRTFHQAFQWFDTLYPYLSCLPLLPGLLLIVTP